MDGLTSVGVGWFQVTELRDIPHRPTPLCGNIHLEDSTPEMHDISVYISALADVPHRCITSIQIILYCVRRHLEGLSVGGQAGPGLHVSPNFLASLGNSSGRPRRSLALPGPADFMHPSLTFHPDVRPNGRPQQKPAIRNHSSPFPASGNSTSCSMISLHRPTAGTGDAAW